MKIRFSQFMSGSIEVLFSKVSEKIEAQMYSNQNSVLHFNPGLALIQLWTIRTTDPWWFDPSMTVDDKLQYPCIHIFSGEKSVRCGSHENHAPESCWRQTVASHPTKLHLRSYYALCRESRAGRGMTYWSLLFDYQTLSCITRVGGNGGLH
jgi:hypothetical protein